MTMLADALDYAAQGRAVFPCRPGTKEPATRRGFKDATTNPATIRRWWLANSN
jgi:Bifunctional DNA primase/polymerase, N-terminal